MSYTEDEFYKFVGEKVKIARQASGMNQDDLAKHVNLQRTSITNIEAGQQKVPIYTLYKIAQAVRVSILALLPPIDEASAAAKMENLLSKQEVLVDDGSISNLSEEEIKNVLKVIKKP